MNVLAVSRRPEARSSPARWTSIRRAGREWRRLRRRRWRFANSAFGRTCQRRRGARGRNAMALGEALLLFGDHLGRLLPTGAMLEVGSEAPAGALFPEEASATQTW